MGPVTLNFRLRHYNPFNQKYFTINVKFWANKNKHFNPIQTQIWTIKFINNIQDLQEHKSVSYSRINFQWVEKWVFWRSVKLKALYVRDSLIMSAWGHKTLLSPPGSKTWWQHRFFLLDRFYQYDECSLIRNEDNDMLAAIGHWLCGGFRKFRQ